MNDERENERSVFLYLIDSDTRASVIRLNQKLKGLQAEIVVKMEMLEHFEDEGSKKQKKQLLMFQEDVEKALQGIDTLVNMVVSDEMTDEEFLEMNHDKLETFRKRISSHVDAIAKIREEL